MNIPYRTRRVLNRVGTVLLAVLLVGIVAWLCWVIWLERYIVYTKDGATLDFQVSANDYVGEVALPPVAAENISIYFNEGSDAMNVGNELTQLSGYYIDSAMLQQDIAGVQDKLDKLPSGTPIMIDMKGGYGSFYYPSSLGDAIHSASVDVKAVGQLVDKMQSKGFYTIARVSAFQDYNYGLNHVPSGLYMLSRAGLWADSSGLYWLDPTNATTTSWIASVVKELKDMGFNEVMLDNFCFPNSDQYIFNGDKDGALQAAATTLMTECASSDFTLSFCVDSAAFVLPEGRCRLYMDSVEAKDVAATAAQVDIDDPEIRLVFVAETNDTRFDQYGVLRSLSVSEVVEAQKAAQAN